MHTCLICTELWHDTEEDCGPANLCQIRKTNVLVYSCYNLNVAIKFLKFYKYIYQFQDQLIELSECITIIFIF